MDRPVQLGRVLNLVLSLGEDLPKHSGLPAQFTQ